MARLRNYIQDESKPFGVGDFELDDGSSFYLDDPERAREFLDQFQTQSNDIAERGSVDRQGEELDGKSRYENAVAKLAGAPEPNAPFQGIDTGPSLMRRAVAGPGGGEEPVESRAEPEENMSRAPEPERPPLTPDELRDADASERLAKTSSLVSRTRPGVNPAAMQRGAVPVAKSFSRKGGVPEEVYSAQAADRATVFTEGNELVARQYAEDEAVNMSRAEQLRAEALKMKQDNDKQELAVAKKNERYEADRAYLQKEVDDFYDNDQVDPDRRKKERGVFGGLGAAIAQFMGAYAAIITGSPNFANQILSKKIDNDIDAQIENFKRGKMKRDGQLQRMAERGMSVDQMKAALRVQRELEVQKEVKASALSEGTREAKQAAQALLMDRKDRFVTAENDYRIKALGEETVSGEIVAPRGPTAKTPLELAKETADLQFQLNRMAHEARGGDVADKAEERDFRRSELDERRAEAAERRAAAVGKVTDDQAKAESAWATLEAYGDAAGIRKDAKTGERLADQGIFSRDTLIAPGQRERLKDLTGQGKPIDAARRAAVEGVGRLQSGGVISPAEEENFKRLLGDENATRAQIATNLNALRTLIQNRRSKANQEETGGAPSNWKSGQ